MSKIPPLLPVETVRRLLRVAHADGTSVLFVAGIGALMAAASQDKWDAGLLLLVCGAGGLELHGANLIGRGERGGIRWLIGSQFFLLVVMLCYVGVHMLHLHVPAFNSMVPDELKQQAATQSGVTPAEFGQQFDALIGFSIVLLTLLYQGWMIFYYSRRRQALKAFFNAL